MTRKLTEIINIATFQSRKIQDRDYTPTFIKETQNHTSIALQTAKNPY
jgi:hypothetical protein